MSNHVDANGADVLPPALPPRFGRRWCFAGAGLSNVWRFGDLELPAASGRLLMRGTNGTGKTTALEALIPYLLDLNANRLSAGKARTTSLTSLMREGAGKRRVGYAWLSFSDSEATIWSFGVRINYSESGSPPVKVNPFTVKGRPLQELQLYDSGRVALSPDDFEERVKACAGQVFVDEQAYVAHLSARLFTTSDSTYLKELLDALRGVRNPNLLGEVSPQNAADALRATLPAVDEEVITATADALAESDTTRDTFERDKQAAEELQKFKEVWSAHATDVVSQVHRAADAADGEMRKQQKEIRQLLDDLEKATSQSEAAAKHERGITDAIAAAETEIKALEKTEAYQSAPRLADLRNTAKAMAETAASALKTLQSVANTSAHTAEQYQAALTNVITDIKQYCDDARAVDPAAEDGRMLLSFVARKRPALVVGSELVEAGLELTIHGTSDSLSTLAKAWDARAERHDSRAKSANLALVDYRPVKTLHDDAIEKEGLHRKALSDVAVAQQKSADAAQSCRKVVQQLVTMIASWSARLRADAHSLSDCNVESILQIDDLCVEDEEIRNFERAEPAQVLAETDEWAVGVLESTQAAAAEFRSNAKQESTKASELRSEARSKREIAKELRLGKLLPFPRPEWAGSGDDNVALGSVLEWRDGFGDENARALLEAAIAGAGLLGATLAEHGALTLRWRVDATGPTCDPSLADVLMVDAAHPLAAAGAAVLSRIQLAPSANSIPEIDARTGLIIGRDGSFCAGVLSGRIPGADDHSLLPKATFVGARQRLAAARARADLLDSEAATLEASAVRCEARAEQLTISATTIANTGQSFPSREELRTAESKRISFAQELKTLEQHAADARVTSDSAKAAFEKAHHQWAERTRACDLPADEGQLSSLASEGVRVAKELRRASDPLQKKLIARLDSILNGYNAEAVHLGLLHARSEAQLHHDDAVRAQQEVQILDSIKGAAIQDVLLKHEHATGVYNSKRKELSVAREQKDSTAAKLNVLSARVTDAERHLHQKLQPDAIKIRDELSALLSVKGVSAAVSDGDLPKTDDGILDFVLAKLKGRRTYTVKTLMERADEAKSRVAGLWSISPGEQHGNLITYVLTHNDVSYSPFEAADFAQKLMQRRQAALDEAEEKALREFVIGRLPGAIRKAWIKLQDWILVVNKKMRFAAASSGVGVQVRAPLVHELPPASRLVYELTCKMSDVDRSRDQQRQLGDALKALLDAAQGDTMQQRVASAVDIREWVEVYYEIVRADGARRWNSKTGLSGGERRLVVLAPMLAALAAGYDRFGPNAARLVALDEIPAEVDERGREGLARYIAQLDLDLICTSYLWDGCPGAWDGVDAHDLEAGPDGTVVAFPMLIRGQYALPEFDNCTLASDEQDPS